MSSDRTYHSPVRQKQADETRRGIASAARKLLLARGFAGATIDAIAKEAGVAPQTVYAVFGSKQGILAEILDQARFSDRYEALIAEAMKTDEPETRLRFAGKIARQIFDSERSELELLRGAGVVSPELAMKEQDREATRYSRQAGMIEFLAESKCLKPELEVTAALDILWALTSRELYRSLVISRGWTGDAYEVKLGDLLVAALMKPAKAGPPGRSRK